MPKYPYIFVCTYTDATVWLVWQTWVYKCSFMCKLWFPQLYILNRCTLWSHSGSLFFILHLFVCMCIPVCVPMHVCARVAHMQWLGSGGQRTTSRHQFSPATMEVVGLTGHQPQCQETLDFLFLSLRYFHIDCHSICVVDTLPPVYWDRKLLGIFYNTISFTVIFNMPQIYTNDHRTEWKHAIISKSCTKEIHRGSHLMDAIRNAREICRTQLWDSDCLSRQTIAGLFLLFSMAFFFSILR